MNKKKIKITLLLLTIISSITLITGCEDKEIKGLKLITCTRKTEGIDKAKASLKYKIYHDGTFVKRTISTEKITSTDRDTLKKYKEAYENVFSNYKDIEHYENNISTTSDSVTSTTTIDYDKVNYKEILKVEGEEDNIFTDDGKVKLQILLDLYKKYGATCDN